MRRGAQGGGEVVDGGATKLRGGRRKRNSEPKQAVEDEPEGFEVSITLPTQALGELFETFTAQEKADAVAGVLQARMDALVS